MSFGRSFLELIFVLCPMQNIVTGSSIQDVHNKGERGQGKRHPYNNDRFFQRKSGQRRGRSKNAHKSRRPLWMALKKADATKVCISRFG